MAFTAITNNIDWQAVAFLNEYAGAQRERELVVFGSASTDLVVAGDDIQRASPTADSLIYNLQTDSGALWAQFNDNTVTNFNDVATLEETAYADLNDLLDKAGITDGFRRATAIPTDWTDYADAAYSYGFIQVGDIIGPWIWADLQAVYKALTRTAKYSSSVTLENLVSRYSLTGNVATWTAAKTAAEAAWSSAGGATSLESRAMGIQTAGGLFQAGLYHRTVKYRIAVISAAFSRTVTYYLIPVLVGASGTFDDQDDVREDGDPIAEDVLNAMLVEVHGTGEGTSILSNDHIGSVVATTKPANWGAEPAASTEVNHGWRSSGAESATIDWDFTYK